MQYKQQPIEQQHHEKRHSHTPQVAVPVTNILVRNLDDATPLVTAPTGTYDPADAAGLGQLIADNPIINTSLTEDVAYLIWATDSQNQRFNRTLYYIGPFPNGSLHFCSEA